MTHQRSVRKCGYCSQPGHTIQRCNHEDIADLYSECVDVATFSLLGLSGVGYMKHWLASLTLPELKVLMIKSGGKGLVISTEEVHEYCTNLCNIHYWFRIKETKATLEEKFERISDARFLGFIDELITMLPEQQLQLLLLSNIMRPPQIKFPIVPVLAFNKESNSECPICYEASDISVTTNCGHSYCSPCLKKYFKSFNKSFDTTCVPGCPLCRTKIDSLAVPDKILFDEIQSVYCK